MSVQTTAAGEFALVARPEVVLSHMETNNRELKILRALLRLIGDTKLEPNIRVPLLPDELSVINRLEVVEKQDRALGRLYTLSRKTYLADDDNEEEASE